MEIEKVKINDIIPYANNAKIHTSEQIEQIKDSIKEFGFNDPIAIDENNTVIEGNGRLQALKELYGKEYEVECIRLSDLSEEQKKAYILVHNKLTMNTGFDIDILSEELSNITDLDMTIFGFDDITEAIEEDTEESKPEIEFTEVLGEEHNYIVLYFDNDIDWLQAQNLFDIQPKKNLSTRKDGKVNKNMERISLGRVLNGAEAINKILGDMNAN